MIKAALSHARVTLFATAASSRSLLARWLQAAAMPFGAVCAAAAMLLALVQHLRRTLQLCSARRAAAVPGATLSAAAPVDTPVAGPPMLPTRAAASPPSTGPSAGGAAPAVYDAPPVSTAVSPLSAARGVAGDAWVPADDVNCVDGELPSAPAHLPASFAPPPALTSAAMARRHGTQPLGCSADAKTAAPSARALPPCSNSVLCNTAAAAAPRNAVPDAMATGARARVAAGTHRDSAAVASWAAINHAAALSRPSASLIACAAPNAAADANLVAADLAAAYAPAVTVAATGCDVAAAGAVDHTAAGEVRCLNAHLTGHGTSET